MVCAQADEWDPIGEKKKNKGGKHPVVEHTVSLLEALGLIPNTTQKRQKVLYPVMFPEEKPHSC